jgi:hypothetical protein
MMFGLVSRVVVGVSVLAVAVPIVAQAAGSPLSLRPTGRASEPTY